MQPAPNPLLASSNVSLQDSFGGIRAPALLTPVAASGASPAPPASAASPAQNAQSGSTSGALGDSFNLTSLPPLVTPSLSASSSSTSLGPPPPGVFLLPSRSEATPSSGTSAPLPPPPVLSSSAGGPPSGAPPTRSGNAYSLAGGGGARTPRRYVAPPDIPAQVNSVGPPVLPPASVSTPSHPPHPPMSSGYSDYGAAPGQWSGRGDAPDASPFMTESASPPDLAPPAGGPPLASAWHYPTSPAGPGGHHPLVPPVAFHWFYHAPAEGENTGQWQPFTMIDSVALEDAYLADPTSPALQPTHGGRYDVNVAQREKRAVYWTEAAPAAVRRCSWFHKSNVDGRWSPYAESVAAQLEAEYVAGVQSGQWNKKLELENGEHIILHSPSVMMHFPSHLGINANLDDWGQVQPQDPQQKPRVVHRGLEGLPEIPDGETPEVDHLVFVVHGIGSVCDIRFRSIVQVVDGFRELSSQLSDRHFQSGRLAETVNRIEYLPVNWHKTLHGEDTGTDRRIRPLALKSIPKLREFVSDTLLDILFYTSPIYCQTIINTVVSEINRMYTLFMKRNPHFKGTASVMGHSLGSLILFDVLSHQSETAGTTAGPADSDCENALESSRHSRNQSPGEVELALERVFEQLGLSEFSEIFTREGIDMQSLLLCTEDDLKESGLPLGPRKKLQSYIETQKAKRDRSLTGLEAFMQSSVTEEVKYSVGPAGTGQPSVEYPALCFKPAAFYALGSPISMFLAVRGMDTLGKNFKLPTCSRFFNIFHPYDPVAYRIESLIDPEYAKMRPLIIPHHKGRKRMHLEIKDTVTKLMTTDFKQKIFDSFSATLNTMYSIAVGSSADSTPSGKSETLAQALEDSMKQNADESEQADRMNPRTLESPLNSGKRIDYALQEAPLESFNEYLFALASHLVYWESEDTCLMIVKDIYEQMNILSDEAKVVNSVPYLDTTTRPPALQTMEALQQSKTPILAPPPVPMGGTMSGPAVRVNPTSVELPPATSPAANVNILGPTPTAAVLGGGYGTNVSTPLGPPPVMMPPSNAIPSPHPTKRAGPYPQPIFPPSNLPPSVVSTSAATKVLGMDPTAPVANQGPIAPPPLAGFYSKK